MRCRSIAALCAAWAISCAAIAAPVEGKFEKARPSADARLMVEWIEQTGDAAGKPFIVVDKKAARVFVFDAAGRLRADTPALLGAARGDSSVPGVGERAQNGTLQPQDLTTPAGRFVTHPGHNIEGEPVIWVDYAAALAIHRLRPGRSKATRTARLQSPRAQERRVSLGCVVVPVAFYLDVIEPLFGSRRGVVYVLPETPQGRELFTQLL
jgi:hypothetical protein